MSDTPKSPPKVIELSCQACGDMFSARRRDARYCLKCKPTRNQARDRRRLDAYDPEGADERAKREQELPDAVEHASRALRYAASMVACGGNRRLAAAVAQIPEDEDLDALEAVAKAEYPEVFDASPGAVQKLIHAAVQLQAVMAMLRASELKPSVAASSISQLAKALEQLNSGARAVHSKIEVIFDFASAADSPDVATDS